MGRLCLSGVLCIHLLSSSRSFASQPEVTPNPAVAVEQIRQRALEHMLKFYNEKLEDPEDFHKMTREECWRFPEGAVYPYVMPALGYVNLIIDGKIEKEEAVPKIRALLEMALIDVGRVIRVPNGDYLQLNDYRDLASFVSVLNLGLSAYSLVSDDGHFKAINDHLSLIFLTSMQRSGGKSLQSWPNVIWHMDTTSALASLDLWKAPKYRARVKLITQRHFHWRKQNETLRSGLTRAGDRENNSRGCDLSYQLCFLPSLDPQYSKEIYQAYCQNHWMDYRFLFGFTEWPVGTAKPGLGDFDSGPVFMQIGGTASGMGIAAAKANGDPVRYERLIRELSMICLFIRSAPESQLGREMLKWMQQFVSKGIGPEYYTGFLYGDAFLFYTLSWTPYPKGNVLTD